MAASGVLGDDVILRQCSEANVCRGPVTTQLSDVTRCGSATVMPTRLGQSGVPLRLVAPKPPMKLIALLVLSGVGLALIAVGVTGHTGWTLIVVGFVALLVALPPIWMIQRSRDRTLR